MVNLNSKKRILKTRRQKRVRAKITGSESKPRLSVFRSNSHIYAQLIDDETGKILVSASDLEIKTKAKKVDLALEVGKLLSEKAKKIKIDTAVFDRAGYKYHGRVKNIAEGFRVAGKI